MSEVQKKLKRIRALMKMRDAALIRLRGVDWFSWATAGGSSMVILTTETGVAEVLITADRAFVLTNDIERDRLRTEELPADFEIVVTKWHEADAADKWVKVNTPGLTMSDRPTDGEMHLPHEMITDRLRMMPEERERYRVLGRDTAEAMSEALNAAEPSWSEQRLAGEGARALWSRGIHPTLILVGGESRIELHRHPVPTAKPIGKRAMMVFCGRRHGLYANLTRFISFRKHTAEEDQRMKQVAEIEAIAFSESRPGNYLNTTFEVLSQKYIDLGLGSEVDKQHFGGLTGYLSREAFARHLLSLEPSWPIVEDAVVAWNPSLPGAKIEDTVLIGNAGLEILTVDKNWPTFTLEGRARPAVLYK